MTTSPRPACTRGASGGDVVVAVAGAAAPCAGGGWLGGDGRVQAASTAAIPMATRSRAPRVVRIVRLRNLGPDLVRALPPLQRHRPTGSSGGREAGSGNGLQFDATA